MNAEDENFLSRWSRRKQQVRKGEPLTEAAARPPTQPDPLTVRDAATTQQVPSGAMADVSAAPVPGPGLQQHSSTSSAVDPSAQVKPTAPAAPTMADVGALTRESDYSRFMGGHVQPEVKNAALAKLFQDPHFNVMDGLDVYIDDYGKPDPLPQSMLRQMVQAHAMGLFADENPPPPAAGASAATSTPAPVAVAAAATAGAEAAQTPLTEPGGAAGGPLPKLADLPLPDAESGTPTADQAGDSPDFTTSPPRT